jgi:hypothetical protein
MYITLFGILPDAFSSLILRLGIAGAQQPQSRPQDAPPDVYLLHEEK